MKYTSSAKVFRRVLSLALVCLLFSNSIVFAQTPPVKIGDHHVHWTLGRLLAEGQINSDDTCLDEFYQSYNKAMTRGIAGTIGAGVMMPSGGSMIAGLVITTISVSANGCGIFGPCASALPFISAAGYSLIFLAAIGIGLSTYWIIDSATKHSLLRLMANAHDGEGKKLDQFSKNLRKKLRSTDGHPTSQEVALAIQSLDQQSSLCDGSLTGKKRRLLVKKSELFKLLKKHFRP